MPNRPPEVGMLQQNVIKFEHHAKNARITALVLGFISLLLFSAGYALFGMGTLSPTFLVGLGLFPYLAGALLTFIGLGLIIGMLVFVAIAAVRTSQKEHCKHALQL